MQNNIFNYVKVGGQHWPCKVTHLTGNQVLEDEWLTFFPNIASVSCKKLSCNVSTCFSALILPSQGARLRTFLDPADPQNMTDVEFENFGTKHF